MEFGQILDLETRPILHSTHDQTIISNYDNTVAHTHAATHASLASSLAAATLPWLQVLDLIVDLIHDLMVCLQLEQMHCR